MPGVFVPPWDAVNGPLWTIKYELACYIVALAVFLFPQSCAPIRFRGALRTCRVHLAGAGGVWQIPSAATVDDRVFRFEYFNMGFFRYYAAIFLLASVARIVVGNSPYRWFGVFLFLGCVYAVFYGAQVALLAVYATIALGGSLRWLPRRCCISMASIAVRSAISPTAPISMAGRSVSSGIATHRYLDRLGCLRRTRWRVSGPSSASIAPHEAISVRPDGLRLNKLAARALLSGSAERPDLVTRFVFLGPAFAAKP